MSNLVREKQYTSDEKLFDKGPFVSLFRDLLLDSIEKNVSDIHVEPSSKELVIRQRVNGELILWNKLKKDFMQSFLYETKQLTGMSIAKKGREQSSRVSFPSINVELRGSAMPTLFEDKLVYRIIYLNKSINLTSLGHDESIVTLLQNTMSLKEGLVLLSGPTGSGKSSTLYGMLNELDRKSKNIITIEDPVERIIQDTTSVQIKSGFDFKDAIKVAMRQDPDVIFIGEIRDNDTAKLAIEAAQTGHLVLSSIHANSSLNVIDRFQTLGVNKEQLRETLVLSCAQRLIKILCKNCLHKGRITESLYNKKVSNTRLSNISKRNVKGCEKCNYTGIEKRLPILEYANKKSISKYILDPVNTKLVNTLNKKLLFHILSGHVCASEIRECSE